MKNNALCGNQYLQSILHWIAAQFYVAREYCVAFFEVEQTEKTYIFNEYNVPKRQGKTHQGCLQADLSYRLESPYSKPARETQTDQSATSLLGKRILCRAATQARATGDDGRPHSSRLAATTSYDQPGGEARGRLRRVGR